jgi:hypothetical protein
MYLLQQYVPFAKEIDPGFDLLTILRIRPKT